MNDFLINLIMEDGTIKSYIGHTDLDSPSEIAESVRKHIKAWSVFACINKPTWKDLEGAFCMDVELPEPLAEKKIWFSDEIKLSIPCTNPILFIGQFPASSPLYPM